ncbi:hypothetical protein DMUE_1377 [Dictyocoela muelleri]|nr:hypothetical protein DMUE_1377 [Dictyocoela muelleri]
MYGNLRKYFEIKNLIQEIKNVVKKCKCCNLYKDKKYSRKCFSKIESSTPFEKISTDIYGPFEISNFKHNLSVSKLYYLTITDIYSRFTQVYLLKKFNRNNLIKKIEIWLNEFKKPKTIISDNCKQYTSKIFGLFFKI